MTRYTSPNGKKFVSIHKHPDQSKFYCLFGQIYQEFGQTLEQVLETKWYANFSRAKKWAAKKLEVREV